MIIMMNVSADVNVAVVVGARDVIGAAVVDACAARGDVVVPVDADIASFDELCIVADSVAAEHPAVHTLVNCHFAIDWTNFRDATFESWEHVVRTNVLGPVAASKAFLPLLEAARGGASIVHLGSVDGFQGNPHVASYSASKGAIPSLTHVMADALAPFDIRVNCVARAAVADPSIDAGVAVTRDGDDTAAPAGPSGGDRRGRAVPLVAGGVVHHRLDDRRRRRPHRPDPRHRPPLTLSGGGWRVRSRS